MSQTKETVVLISGATSGIGKATAELLAERGYRVFGTSRKPAGKKGLGFELVQLDVTSEPSVSKCVTEVARRTKGRIDVLVNNAGTGVLGAAEEVSAEEADRLFQVNLFGAMRMTSAVLPLMRARGSGTIINMSSSGGVASIPFAGLYCATKHALEAYTSALRQELRPLGLWATVVAPGPVSTPAGDSAARAARTIAEYADRRAHADAMYTDAIRQGMDPIHVARTILRIVGLKQPRPRYPVGLQSRVTTAARRLMPPSAFEAAVRMGLM